MSLAASVKIGACTALVQLVATMVIPEGMLPFGLGQILSAGKQDPIMSSLHSFLIAMLGTLVAGMFFGVTATGGPLEGLI